jgi:predicted dehydrogenase
MTADPSAAGQTRRRYAFVGTGHRAELYFAALLGSHADVGEPVALCDVNPHRMAFYEQMRQEALPGSPPLPTYAPQDFDVMLERERPDAVVVTSVDHTHADYISRALNAGRDVITEKPLTIDADGCRTIVEAAERADGELVVTFNYRYSPRNSAVKQLLSDGAIGEVTSVHFDWLLDTVHGADYFRRWHRDKSKSGGLFVHKATHHFDLVNWWLAQVPQTVFAMGSLSFYGAENAAKRGLGERPARSHGAPGLADDPFALDLTASDRLRRLYLDAEVHDGYVRDQDVFSRGITIEDNMAVLVHYAGGPILSYSLNAHAPWEGYRVGFNGTEGRLELTVVERPHVEAASAGQVVGKGRRPAVDPSYTPEEVGAEDADPVRQKGSELVLQRHWERARRIPIMESGGSHGGGDDLLLDDLFRRGTTVDPLGRRAGYIDGVRSVLVGHSANVAVATGRPVDLVDYGLPLEAPVFGQA